MVGLPIIPHCDFDPECSGCLCAVVDDGGIHFVCNECGVVLTKEEVALLIITIESCEATCTHCGTLNEIDGFSEVFAFVCRYCALIEGRTDAASVNLKDAIHGGYPSVLIDMDPDFDIVSQN